MLCLSAPIDCGQTELPLGLVSLCVSLNPIPVISGSASAWNVCNVLPEVSGLSMCLQSSSTRPEIPEFKMPMWLLFVTVSSSMLPQWAPSRLSNNADTWAGFEDLESPPAYQIGKIKAGWWYFHKPSERHDMVSGEIITSPAFQFSFWLNSSSWKRTGWNNSLKIQGSRRSLQWDVLLTEKSFTSQPLMLQIQSWRGGRKPVVLADRI